MFRYLACFTRTAALPLSYSERENRYLCQDRRSSLPNHASEALSLSKRPSLQNHPDAGRVSATGPLPLGKGIGCSSTILSLLSEFFPFISQTRDGEQHSRMSCIAAAEFDTPTPRQQRSKTSESVSQPASQPCSICSSGSFLSHARTHTHTVQYTLVAGSPDRCPACHRDPSSLRGLNCNAESAPCFQMPRMSLAHTRRRSVLSRSVSTASVLAISDRAYTMLLVISNTGERSTIVQHVGCKRFRKNGVDR